jgi:hypothetical protein
MQTKCTLPGRLKAQRWSNPAASNRVNSASLISRGHRKLAMTNRTKAADIMMAKPQKPLARSRALCTATRATRSTCFGSRASRAASASSPQIDLCDERATRNPYFDVKAAKHNTRYCDGVKGSE